MAPRITPIQSTEMMTSRGLLPKYSIIHKFGSNPDVDSGTAEDIWSQGGEYTFLDAAATLYVSSSDNSDTVNIQVQGLDADWNVQTKTVTLTGQTQAAIDGTWIRVFRAKNVDATELAGDVYIAETDDLTDGVPDTASKIKAKIDQAEQQTLMAIYTIPNGCYGMLYSWYASLDHSISGTRAVMSFKVRDPGLTFLTKERITIRSGGSSFLHYQYPLPLRYEEKTDITVQATISANNGAIDSGFDLLLKEY